MYIACTIYASSHLTLKLSTLQAAEKFKAPQPAPVIPEAKAATIEQEEESDEEEVCGATEISLITKLPAILQ